MRESLTTPNQPTQPIEAVVKQMLKWLDNVNPHIMGSVRKKLQNEVTRKEFLRWMEETKADCSWPWFEPLERGNLDDAVTSGVAKDCLQVVVLSYLPGPRYFRGAYIHSELRSAADLNRMKEAVQVPHLTGAVGWMTADLLNNIDSTRNHVVLQDAQLDIRGRVAVWDYQLGNRSVAGFPVSTSTASTDLASISGFAFLSHPLAGLFPDPLVPSPISEAFGQLRKKYESALASAIESYIFRRHGLVVLKGGAGPHQARRVPLLTLSADDPTGFLASVLFESDPSGKLRAECDINEDVYLETVAWHLRVANIYPAKWAPEFVKHMARFGDLLENPKFDASAAMAWYARNQGRNPDSASQLYPNRAANTFTVALKHAGELVTWPEWQMDQSSEQSDTKFRSALADLLGLYGTPSDHACQADLVVPTCEDRDGVRHSLGFFRINCDAAAIPPSKSRTVFQNMWDVIANIRADIVPAIAKLLFALEDEGLRLQLPIDRNSEDPPLTTAERVRQIKRWIDLSYLITEWLAQRMHQLVSRLTGSRDMPNPPWETLILVTLPALDSGDHISLKSAFQLCKNRWDDLVRVAVASKDALPEVTLVSFWPRMRLPTIASISHLKTQPTGTVPEDAFADLLRADPGLLRIIVILAPMLQPGETVDLSERTSPKSAEWAGIDFGVPASHDISALLIQRAVDATTPALSVTWEHGGGEHGIQLVWDWHPGPNQPRRLGSHALSTTRGVVARRLGHNLLAGLGMKFSPQTLSAFEDPRFDENKYYYVGAFVSSTGAEMGKRLERVERAMLFGAEASPSIERWRILPLKSQQRPLLAALCDPLVERPMVLAFRDFALANAKAFYFAREYDAQREAANEYARNLSAVAHGYKGPVKHIAAALEDAAKSFRTNRDGMFVSERMHELQEMVEATKTLAGDAIAYAWRKEGFISLTPYDWESLRRGIDTVAKALTPPHRPRLQFETELNEHIIVESSEYLWRHLISKLVENGIEHGANDPRGASTYKVFVRPMCDHTTPRFIVEISNYVAPETLEKAVIRVREGLERGRPDTTEDNHGYGLIEAYHCCELLLIDAEVSADVERSRLLVSLMMALKH